MLLLIPGPVQTRPEVRAALAEDIAPWDDDFRPEYAAIRDRVTEIAGGILGTHATLPLQGAGHFIVEAAIRTFVPVGGKLLVPMNGAYAERIARLATEAGRVVVRLPVPDTRPATREEMQAALEADPEITHLALVYSETGSGIVNDAEGACAAARATGRRVILDAVSGFGALPFRLADHPECDAVVFTSNKCLEGLPGFGFAVAPLERALACQGQAGSWSFDLGDVAAHALRSGWGSFRFTPPVQALRAFGVALKCYEQEGGQPARHARYAQNAAILYDGLLALGLTPYLERRHQGPIIVTVHQPADPRFELGGFVAALKRRGVLISNFHTTQRPTIRIGCIGHVQPDQMRWAVEQIGATLADLGIQQRQAA